VNENHLVKFEKIAEKKIEIVCEKHAARSSKKEAR
jgi:hypothetical protein